jgi:hypothetical protein
MRTTDGLPEMPLWFQQYSSMIEDRLRAIEASIGPRQACMPTLHASPAQNKEAAIQRRPQVLKRGHKA